MKSGRIERMCLEVDGKRRETGDNVLGSGWEADREEIMGMDINLVRADLS